ncbi:MAG: hypothetical protein WA982_06365 [Rubrobacteraceae bacterium]
MTGNKHRRDHSESYADGDELDEPDCSIVNTALVQRLGEAYYGEDAGRIGFLNLVAGSGALMPEGMVLTHEFHRRFLDTGGLAQAIRDSVGVRGDIRRRVRTLRRKYGRLPLEGELNRMICDAIIGLGARTVVVISEDVTRSGLRTIPEAREAVRKAWLSVGGLKRQIEAAERGEKIPTWPVLIQREVHYEPRSGSSRG